MSEGGNWEHVNILRRLETFEAFTKKHDLDITAFKKRLASYRAKLFAVRDKRIKPGLDDKILLNWNALMCYAYAKAYTALGNETYKTIAIANLEFIFEKMVRADGLSLYHTYKECNG